MTSVRIHQEPELRDPLLIAAWPGMGGVAIVAAKYLQDKLGAEEFGEIEPYDFFDPSLVLVRESVVEEPEFPDNKFYFSKGENDLIIFTGDAQPVLKAYNLAEQVLDVAQRFNVKRVYTFAAAPSHIYHTRRPRVLAATTNAGLAPELEKYELTLLKDGSISGLNGVLLGVAKRRNMDGICLLGEIPIYTTQIINPRSSQAVLEVLTKMLGMEIDMTDIDDWARNTEAEIEERMIQLKESYGEEAKGLIDYFEQLAQKASTEEIWFQPEYKTEELLREIEHFLKGKGKQKEEQ